MIDRGLIGFASCIGLIPLFMARVIRDVLNSSSDLFRKYGILYSFIGMLSFNIVPEKGAKDIVVASLVHKPVMGDASLIDASMFLEYELPPSTPRHLLIMNEKHVKKILKSVLDVYGLEGYKPKDLMKKQVKCKGGNRCVFSNYGGLREGTGYLTLSVECRGNMVVFKTNELADKVIGEVFEIPVELIVQLLKKQKVRVRTEDVEAYVARKLYDALKWYIQKYYISLPESLEAMELFRHIV